jgi:hypothetical protein
MCASRRAAPVALRRCGSDCAAIDVTASGRRRRARQGPLRSR